MSETPLITLKGIQKIFYTDEIETWALEDIHLEIYEGEYVAINGPSGCGKSTLAAGLFYDLKLHGLKVELVNEYVKKWAWYGS